MQKIMLEVNDNIINNFYYEEQQEYSKKINGYDLYSFDETLLPLNQIVVKKTTLEEIGAEKIETPIPEEIESIEISPALEETGEIKEE